MLQVGSAIPPSPEKSRATAAGSAIPATVRDRRSQLHHLHKGTNEAELGVGHGITGGFNDLFHRLATMLIE